ncbi:type II toxin-antitoxin system toxin TscT [Staphylococcus haemolyticus]
MNFELNNALCDLEVVQEKINDVVTSFVLFDDEYFTHEPNHMLTKKEIYTHGWKYHEHRIKNTQVIDLMLMYMKDFDDIMKKIREIEKASSSTDQSKDNA